jgi:hypothetical protein
MIGEILFYVLIGFLVLASGVAFQKILEEVQRRASIICAEVPVSVGSRYSTYLRDTTLVDCYAN